MSFKFGIAVMLMTASIGSTCLGEQSPQGLAIIPYDQLGLPPQLNRGEVTWMVQRAADQLYGIGFVDLGDFTDFMHGHVLFRTKDGKGDPPNDHRLTDLNWQPDWSNVTPRAILFHTQEFPNFRESENYAGPNGPLQKATRNWIMWLEDNEYGRRGEFEHAEKLTSKTARIYNTTIYSADLDPAVFGEDTYKWEYSFFFYRVSCGEVQAHVSSFEREKTNIISVGLNQVEYCLALQSMHCTRYPFSEDMCKGGTPLTPVLMFSPPLAGGS